MVNYYYPLKKPITIAIIVARDNILLLYISLQN